MSIELTTSECFQEALDVETKVREAERGRGIKSLIAKKANVSRPTLNKLYKTDNVEKVSSDAIRRRIHTAFNYQSYDEWIEVGKLLLFMRFEDEENPKNYRDDKTRLRQAREKVFHQPPIEINEDYSHSFLEKLNDIDEAGKQEVFSTLQKMWERSWAEKLRLNELPIQKKDRCKSIVDKLCRENNLSREQLITWELSDILVKYIQEEMTDFELIATINSTIRRELFLARLDKI